MQPLRKPVAGEAIEFSVADPKGNVIFRKRDVTSRFGIAAIDCPLATEINEGAYQIQSKVGDTSSQMTVEVKKYVLPKFKINVDLDRPYYEPGQKVRGTISARYFFGKPVRDGEIEIDVASAVFAANSFAHLTARTDASGIAKFEFVLPDTLAGRPQDSGDSRFDLHATLRDAAGQKQSANVSCVVTDQPIHIEVVPESGKLVPGLKNTIYFLASYADGRPAAARIVIAGIDREISTDDLGSASIEFTPETESTTWLIRATDNSGHTGRRELTLESGRFAEPFLVRTDKAVYDGGQTVHISRDLRRSRAVVPRRDQRWSDDADHRDSDLQGSWQLRSRFAGRVFWRVATLRLSIRKGKRAGNAKPDHLRPASRRAEDRRPARSGRISPWRPSEIDGVGHRRSRQADAGGHQFGGG